MAASPSQEGVSPAFMELVGRAITDEQFRDRLYSDREAAVADYRLTDVDQTALDELTRDKLEEQAEVLTHASQISISIKITYHF
jgi:hypothetical protein